MCLRNLSRLTHWNQEMLLDTQNVLFRSLEMNIWAIWKIGNFGIYGHFEDCYNTNIFSCFLHYRSGNYVLQLQWVLEKFLRCFWYTSGYLTTSSDSRLYNDTKIMSVGPLENIGHPILKKRGPHSPFESHFSMYRFAHI